MFGRGLLFITTLAMNLVGGEGGGLARAEDKPMPRAGTSVNQGYASVNGLKLYYEVHGEGHGGTPLVLLHGGGSTIETSFGSVLPALAKTRKVVAFEQQGHGRTADVDRPFDFEQSADDAAALLQFLKVAQADFYGYSNGGSIALQIAIRHPKIVRRLVVASAIFKRDGLDPGVWASLKDAKPENMPPELRQAYLQVAPHPEQLPTFVTKCSQRMLQFKDWRPEVIGSITAPTLVLVGDTHDVRPEHAVEMFRLLPHGQLAVFPGTDHMQVVKRSELLLTILPTFLDAPMPEPTKGTNDAR